MDYPAQRRQKLASLLEEDGVEAYLIHQPVNVTYLTGFTGDSSWLVVGQERCLLVSDARFTEQIGQECPHLEVIIRPPSRPIAEAAVAELKNLGVRSVAFESSQMSVADFENLRELLPTADWKPVRERVESLRVIKDESEIAGIKQAIHFAERAFEAFRAQIRLDDTEKDLVDAMEAYVRRAGAEKTSFPTIVAVGERGTASCTADQQARKRVRLSLGGLGAAGPLYKSDLTRILVPRTNSAFSKPKTDAKLETVHGLVLKAQLHALSMIRPGVKAHDVDAAVRAIFGEAGYGERFGHGLGHGLGLQVHEAPSLRPNSTTVLQPGMVVTVEPGIYLPGWGGVRLEDDVLVTPDGCEILTKTPKGLAESICSI